MCTKGTITPINRVRRIRGQIDAIERALEEEKGCM
ncbi:TPA: metal-sensing transcriptional repressor, partial [Staphylococcus aureus]|nr:metal-sensing transcriptional repressor [Staphylococcus aureus]